MQNQPTTQNAAQGAATQPRQPPQQDQLPTNAGAWQQPPRQPLHYGTKPDHSAPQQQYTYQPPNPMPHPPNAHQPPNPMTHPPNAYHRHLEAQQPPMPSVVREMYTPAQLAPPFTQAERRAAQPEQQRATLSAARNSKVSVKKLNVHQWRREGEIKKLNIHQWRTQTRHQ